MAGDEIVDVDGPCVSIEMCSGREGADDYVKITPDDIDAQTFAQLLGVITTQIWSMDL